MDKHKRILNLNKTCKYCHYCNLLIADKDEVELFIKQFLGVNAITEKEYFIAGTLDRKVYRKMAKEGGLSEGPLHGASFFKNVWEFTMQPSGWHPR
ncbi:MAG: hypothetical protein QME12_08810 [Nanoarchaeota archaeon]|nr:hypothetical protein [Nanoarchaeota archaeon]